MSDRTRKLSEYLAVEYPFHVVADPDGGYAILYPDLPGCMTQVESLNEVGPMAEEIRHLWIETQYRQGEDIPPPSYPGEYSGKFVLRIPRSLHRSLAENAESDGVSLNQYIATLLAQRDVQRRVERRLDGLERQFGVLREGSTASE